MSETEPIPLADLVRILRLTAGLSQEELAERSGLSARAISDIERGLRLTPRPETIRMLSDALALTESQRNDLLAAAHPELRTRAASLPTDPPAVNAATIDLPIPPTPLIGREREVTHLLNRLLNDGNRLITLTGPGGVGKTRLALEVARRAASSYPGGAFFVDLAPVRDPDLVASTIAQSLEVRESGDRTILQSLQTALTARPPMLLLLDNFEQIIDAASLVKHLLTTAAKLHILITSREALRLRDEYEAHVDPLELPGIQLSDEPGLLAEVPAIALFVRTVQTVKPEFGLTTGNAETVAEICRRLDGLPLAVELAATRIRHFPPDVLLEHLDRRLPLLTGGPRDSPVRQQTLRDTILWSYELLSADEKTLLRWLGVFVGGSTLESIEAVISAAGSLESDLLGVLSSLVDKSLLKEFDDSSASPRFSMLELVREFALEQLHQNQEYEVARQAHAQHFLNFAETRGPTFITSLRGFAGHERVEAEIDNVRSAIARFDTNCDANNCARFAAATWHYFYLRGFFREGRALCQRSLELAATQPIDDEVRVLVLASMCIASDVLGDPVGGSYYGEQGLDLARRLPPGSGLLPWSLISLAIALRDQRLFAEATKRAEEALDLAYLTGDEYFEPFALYHIGRLAYLQGDLDRATVSLEESLRQIRNLGPTETALYTINTLAAVYVRRNIVREAAGLLREGRLHLRRSGYAGFWFDTAVLLAAQCEFPDAAVRLLGFYSAYYASIGVEEIPVDPRLEAVIIRLREELGVSEFDAAYRDGSQLTSAEAEAIAIAMLDSVEQSADS